MCKKNHVKNYVNNDIKVMHIILEQSYVSDNLKLT